MFSVFLTWHFYGRKTFFALFQEAQYETKSYEHETINIQAIFYLIIFFLTVSLLSNSCLFEVILHWFSVYILRTREILYYKDRLPFNQSSVLDRLYCVCVCIYIYICLLTLCFLIYIYVLAGICSVVRKGLGEVL
jgi:hypothetical protein